jgi:hypothetical protein
LGRITSTWNARGITVGGVILGEPATSTAADGSDLFVWDGDIPDGVLNDEGVIITPGPTVADVPLDTFVGVTGQEIPEPDVPPVVVEDVCSEDVLNLWVETTAASDEVVVAVSEDAVPVADEPILG